MGKKVYINDTGHMIKMAAMPIYDDPGLTLTYFACFCTYSKPRYQVSVYRTIGPLVLFRSMMISCAVTFVFIYGKSWFSHDEAHMIILGALLHFTTRTSKTL